MSEDLKILMEFQHEEKSYYLFTLPDSMITNPKAVGMDFLFMYAEDYSLIALFFGEGFQSKIEEILKIGECIECSLGIEIQGGISLDGEDFVEYGLTKADAERILPLLQSKITTMQTFPHF